MLPYRGFVWSRARSAELDLHTCPVPALPSKVDILIDPYLAHDVDDIATKPTLSDVTHEVKVIWPHKAVAMYYHIVFGLYGGVTGLNMQVFAGHQCSSQLACEMSCKVLCIGSCSFNNGIELHKVKLHPRHEIALLCKLLCRARKGFGACLLAVDTGRANLMQLAALVSKILMVCVQHHGWRGGRTDQSEDGDIFHLTPVHLKTGLGNRADESSVFPKTGSVAVGVTG